MMNKKTIYTKYIKLAYMFVCTSFVLSFLLAAFQIQHNYKNQKRYFQIEGVKIDFSEKNSFSIGGNLNQNNNAFTFNNQIDSIADIWLPTSLIPSNIGSLYYINSKSEIEFRLNELIDDNSHSDYLNEKIIFPIIKSSRQIHKKNGVISENELKEGIQVKYAEGNNQYMSLRILKTNVLEYKLLFEPNPNHLLFELENYRDSGNDSLEFSYGLHISTNENCNSTDLIFFPYNFNNNSIQSQTNILVFRDESVQINNEKINSIPGTNILIKLVEKKGRDILWIIVLINMLFIVLLFLFHIDSKNEIFKTRLLFVVPTITLLLLYNISVILLSHYLFHFIFDTYFYRYLISGFSLPIILSFILFFNWNKNNFFLLSNLSLIAVIMFILFQSHKDVFYFLIPFFFLVFFLKSISSFLNKILAKNKKSIVWKNWLFFVLFLPIAAVLLHYTTDSSQRVFGKIPSHTVVRFVIVSCYVFLGMLTFSNKRSGIGELFKITVLFFVIVAFSWLATKDTGFIVLSVLTFILLVIFNPVISSNFKILSLLIIIGGGFYIYQNSNELIGGYRGARFELLKDNYRSNAKISISDKQSTDKHRLLLNQAFNENKFGLWNKFNIPKSFKKVIWSDYILLYALVYFGGYTTVLFVLFLISILIIHLIYIASLNYSDNSIIKVVNNGKNRQKEMYLVPFVTATAFILFSYISQYFYMTGAIFRIFPLTGQSIPFLSFSWMENILFSMFLILSFAFFHKSNEVKKDSNVTVISKVEDSKTFSKILLLVPLLFLAIVIFSMKYKIHFNEFSTIAGKLSYSYEAEKQKVVTYNKILNKVSKDYTDFNEFLNSVTYQTLFEECKNVVGVNNENEASVKAKFIIKELSKIKNGRESYLKIENGFNENGEATWLLKYPPFEKDVQNITYFIENIKKVKKKPNPPIELNNNFINLYVNNNGEFVIYSKSQLDLKANSITGLTLVDEPFHNPSYSSLFDETSTVYIRNVNNKAQLFYCNSEMYSGLPLNISDYQDVREQGLSLDERLQAILYASINIYCRNNNIKAGGIVVIENKTGKIKGLVSYPSIEPNAFDYEKNQFITDNFTNKHIHINTENPSVPLSGYNIASTWKMLQCATALLIDENYKNIKFARQKMSYHIPYSTNPYSVALLKNLLENHRDEFYSIMKSEFDISKNGYIIKNHPHNFDPIFHDNATIGYDLTLDSPQEDIKGTSLGQKNVQIPLIVLTQDMARIITGKKIYPTLIDYKQTFEFENIKNSENLSSLKDYLNLTSREGTAKKLRDAKLNNKLIFNENSILYAKTGTGDASNHHTLIVFGTENYTYGFFLYNKKKGVHAKYLARNVIPYIKLLCPEFINN